MSLRNKRCRLLFVVLPVLVGLAGCSSSVGPQNNNLGIPAGATAGEYGFIVNGNGFDSHSSNYSTSGAMGPYEAIGPRAFRLIIPLDYQFQNGVYGNIYLSIPMKAPQTQTFSFSDANSLWSLNATATIGYDSNGYSDYVSIPGGTVSITKFDTVNNLVSGVFKLSAYETYPVIDLNKTIEISSGYFNDIPIAQGSYGQGNVSALINDTLFSTDSDGFQNVYLDSTAQQFYLNAYSTRSSYEKRIVIENIPLKTGLYSMDPTSNGPVLFYIDYSKPGNQGLTSTLDSGAMGILDITKCDFAHRRLSGTFQFSGADSLGNKISILNGVIDSVRWVP